MPARWLLVRQEFEVCGRRTWVTDRCTSAVAPNGLAEATRTPGFSDSRELALASRWLRCCSLPGDPSSPITTIPATTVATTPSVAVDKRQANRERRSAAYTRTVRADAISRRRCRSRRRVGLARSVESCALPGIGLAAGVGVPPAVISAGLCETSRSKYASVLSPSSASSVRCVPPAFDG